MNNAKMWLVVKPTVGVPLFLSAVAIGSFAVHVAVLTNTTWVADFLAGRDLGSSSEQAALTIEVPEQPTANLASAPAVVGDAVEGDKITVVLPDGTLATAVLERPIELASRTGVTGSPPN